MILQRDDRIRLDLVGRSFIVTLEKKKRSDLQIITLSTRYPLLIFFLFFLLSIAHKKVTLYY